MATPEGREILLQAVEASEPQSGAVNIGLSRSTSLNDLIAELGAATGNPLTVNYQARLKQ